MQHYEYKRAMQAAADYGFYELIQAAMRNADTGNGRRLEAAFPEVWRELQRRYDAPGGLLPGEEDAELGAGVDKDGNLYELDQRGRRRR